MKKNIWISLALSAGLLTAWGSAPALAEDDGVAVDANDSDVAGVAVDANVSDGVGVGANADVSDSAGVDANVGANVGSDYPPVGQVYQELTGDLDRDGQIKRVALIPFLLDKDKDACFMQLVVSDSNGKVLWRSPRLTDETYRKTWGCYAWGQDALMILQDLDNDGHPELISTCPRSDVSPQKYKVWKWDGDKFIYQFTAALLEVEPESGVFKWDTQFWDGHEKTCWIDRLEHKDGRLVSKMTYWDRELQSPSAYMRVIPNGFKVEEWIKRIRYIKY